MDAAHVALVGAAAAAGGAVNAIAGGGSLITFPALVACGIPSVLASATNTVAMCPGYFGATAAQRRELAGQGARTGKLAIAAALGGVAGALLLQRTGEKTFDIVVPFLLVFSVALLAFQGRLRALLTKRSPEGLALPAVALASVYGGYFGAGLGVMLLAVLAVTIEESLVRLNALKQVISLAANVAAAIVFVIVSPLDFVVVGAMAVGSLAGGLAGGALASRVSAGVLRVVVIVIGLAVAVAYFAKL